MYIYVINFRLILNEKNILGFLLYKFKYFILNLLEKRINL